MGKTYHKSSKRFDETEFGNHSGKPAKHFNGKKTGGMRMINNYVEDDYDLNENDFDDEIELDDDISIQHNTNTN